MKHPNRVAAGRKVSGHNTPKTCPKCRSSFLGTGKQVYCSRACKEAAEAADRSPRPCPICLATIDPRGKRGRRPVYCSPTCKGKADNLPLTPRPCANCSAPFTPRRGGTPRHYYCSPDCATAAATALRQAARTGGLGRQLADLATELEGRRDEAGSDQ